MLGDYPKTVVVHNGTRVTLRPMVAADAGKLLEFFRSVPEVDRWYLKEDAADPKVIASWAQGINYDRVLPIVAEVDGNRIVADASLHRHPYGAWRSYAKLRIVVAPEMRDQGLGTWMVLDLINYAMLTGICKLAVELVTGCQEAAMDACMRLGFVKEATLSGVAHGPDGEPLDMVILVKSFYPDWGKF